MKPRLCLNMIVKDEADILERALRSVAPHIACYVIADTGSTDGTPDLIRQFFATAGVPGEVVHTEFVDFGQARNEALDAARASDLEFDYLLLCDADMELQVRGRGFSAKLTEPVYAMTQYSVTGGLSYLNARLLRRDVAGAYVGATHEYLDAGSRPYPRFDDAHFVDHAAGSSRAVKCERDIALLLKALSDDPNDSRSVFYLAQSYRDCGDLAAAMETYRRRVELRGWDEEVWYAKLQIAVLTERLELGEGAVIRAYLEAYEDRPIRAEPLVELARFHRERSRHALALLFASRAMTTPRPSDVLFLDEGTYTWRGLDEYSIASYWTGDFAGSVEACRQLLASDLTPEAERERVAGNLNFSLDKLGPPRE